MRRHQASRSRWRKGLWLLALHALPLLGASCSFLLDFPSENGGAGTGATTSSSKSSGTGGSGGAGGQATCADFASAPTYDKTLWKGTLSDTTTGDAIVTTGLAHDSVTGNVYAFGWARGGIAQIFPATSAYTAMYMVSIPPVGDATLAMSAQACDANTADARSGRMTLFGDGRRVISGGLGYDYTDATMAEPWSLAKSGMSCAPPTVNVGPYNYSDFAQMPFFALVDNATINGDFAGTGDGTSIDVDDNGGHIGSIGVSTDHVFGTTGGTVNGHNYFVQRSTEMTGDETFVLANHFLERHPSPPFTFAEGAVAVDDDGTVWFGGGSCDADFPCNNQGAFLGTLGTVGSPNLLVEQPGAASAITTMDIKDHTAVIGGRYQASLQMLSATLPSATGTDAFVMAIDTATQKVLWTYPTADKAPGFDNLQWESVVDLAILGTRSCGAVYVTGCTVPTTTAGPNCAAPQAGTRGFIAKLDLATGKEIWVDDVQLENPSYEVFLPTALRAYDDKVLLAATTFGASHVAGGIINTTAPVQGLVLELSR